LREIPREELNEYNNYNSGNCNNGFFNTDSPLVRIFNKETDVLFTEGYIDDIWEKTELCQLLKKLSNYFPVKVEVKKK